MTTTKNWPLLTKVVSHIIAHPESWDQTVYANTCGTAFCVAGHAAVMVGGNQLQLRDLYPEVTMYQKGGDHEDLGEDFTDQVTLSKELQKKLSLYSNKPALDMADVGQAALGLSHLEANHLFDGDNALGDILTIVRHWADEDDIELPSNFFGDRWCAYDWETDPFGELYRVGRGVE